MKTIFNTDSHRLFADLASELVAYLERTPRETIPVALPGGRSVVGLLRALSDNFARLSTEKRHRLQFFILDERRVPLDSHQVVGARRRLGDDLGAHRQRRPPGRLGEEERRIHRRPCAVGAAGVQRARG